MHINRIDDPVFSASVGEGLMRRHVPVLIGIMTSAILCVTIWRTVGEPSRYGFDIPRHSMIKHRSLRLNREGFYLVWTIDTRLSDASEVASIYRNEFVRNGYNMMHSRQFAGKQSGWSLAAFKGSDPDYIVTCEIKTCRNAEREVRSRLTYKKVISD